MKITIITTGLYRGWTPIDIKHEIECSGLGTELDPAIIEPSENLPSAFRLEESDLFITIKDCYLDKLMLISCQNVRIENCNTWSLSILDCSNILIYKSKIRRTLHLTECNGNKVDSCNITKWEFYKDWNVPEDQVYEIFYQIYEGTTPTRLMDKNIPKILKKINKCHHVDILSARNSHYKQQLKEQLQENNIIKGLSYNKIILVNEKPYDLKLQHKYDLYIDDNPNLIAPIKGMSSKTLFLYDQPWNRQIISNSNVIRIMNWKQILKELNQIIRSSD